MVLSRAMVFKVPHYMVSKFGEYHGVGNVGGIRGHGIHTKGKRELVVAREGEIVM